MKEITIPLQEDQLEALQVLASRYGLSPEEIARVGLEDMLAQPDDVVQRVFDRVIKKNRELYKRLA
jgi:RecA-family ATPase